MHLLLLFVSVAAFFVSTADGTGYVGKSFRQRVMANAELDHCIRMCGNPSTSHPLYAKCVAQCNKMHPY